LVKKTEGILGVNRKHLQLELIQQGLGDLH
jgi:hypothetical protein